MMFNGNSSTDSEKHKLADILLVDDNPGDVRLTQEAFKTSSILNRLFVVNDGIEAMRFLRRQGGYADATRPDLVLLDLNLPGKSGQEVLTEIKNDQELKSIPVFVLTISSAESDVGMAYARHADCFITKPIDFYQFQEVVRKIEDFWRTGKIQYKSL